MQWISTDGYYPHHAELQERCTARIPSMLTSLRQKLREDGEFRLTVKVRPNASNSAFKGTLSDGTWKIDIAAIAEDGKANAELIRFLAEEFGIANSHVEIIKGQHSPRKVLRITV